MSRQRYRQDTSVIQGYNGQAFVDDKHQIIVGAEAFGTGPDNDLLEPMIEAAEKNMTSIGKSADYFEGKTIAADTGYFSEALPEGSRA